MAPSQMEFKYLIYFESVILVGLFELRIFYGLVLFASYKAKVGLGSMRVSLKIISYLVYLLFY